MEQYTIPVIKRHPTGCKYDIYPSFRIEEDRIFAGFELLAERISDNRIILIDGYAGVFFNEIRDAITGFLKRKGLTSSWISTADLFRSEEEILEMTKPFLGGDDPLFGKRTTLTLSDYFRREAPVSVTSDPSVDCNFVIGPGASLFPWQGLLLYADVPKNELQRRARRGLITNLP